MIKDSLLSSFKSRNAWLVAAMASYAIYSIVFIFRTSFTVNGERYFSLFDDAMISMRYARNLAHGYGLVWNVGGERVEGFTNPLWVLYMALWHLPPLPESQVSLAIQLTSALCLLVNLYFVHRIAVELSGGSRMVSAAAVLLTAFYLPLNNWSLQGMEVGLLTLISTVVIWLAARTLRSGPVSPWLYVLLGVAVLVRLDATVLGAAVILFLALADAPRRAVHLAAGALAIALSLGVQTTLRLWYYGDFFPNTYYLKLTGYPLLLRVEQGFQVFVDFLGAMYLGVFVAAFAILLFKRDRAILLLCCVFAVQAAYSIYVGGDAWEQWGGSNRYISIVMPAFFLLLAHSLWFLVLRLREALTTPPGDDASRRSVILPALGLELLLGSATYYVASKYLAPVEALVVTVLSLLPIGLLLVAASRWELLPARRLPVGAGGRATVDGNAARRYAGYVMLLLTFISLVNLNALQGKTGLHEWLFLSPPMHTIDNHFMVEDALRLRQITNEAATVLVVWGGALPYFADRQMIDFLGKADQTIAHQEVRLNGDTTDYRQFRPGHMKWDYDYSIGQLKPDVVSQLWPTSDGSELVLLKIPPQAQQYLAADYVRTVFQGRVYYLRKGSRNVQWSMLSVESQAR